MPLHIKNRLHILAFRSYKFLSGFLSLSVKNQVHIALATCLDAARRTVSMDALLDWKRYYDRQLTEARNIIEKHNPCAMFMAEDNVELKSIVYAFVCQQARIPALVTPYTFCTPMEPAESYFHEPGYRIFPFNVLYRTLLRNWTYRHKGTLMRRIPSTARILAMRSRGIRPRMPWVLNGSGYSHLLVESPAMKRFYLAQGIPEESLIDTGSPLDDSMTRISQERTTRKASLCRRLGLTPEKPLLLLAVPPNQFLSNRANLEFQRYDELLTYLARQLESMSEWNTVIKFHPRMDVNAFRYVESRNVKICTEDTHELIPLCDLYLASISATIRWAIACGVPVLNYDLYRYDYDDFGDTPGVVTFDSKKRFESLLHELNQPVGTLLAELTARQRSSMHDWGHLDGMSARRIRDCVRTLGASRDRNAPESSPSACEMAS
ncbi:hypothetical protein QPK87_02090 [Kamptonema cortianum]|nr:hypothetical protein [Kamptonema cortianum]MDL5046125.1 hypothetical protein [Oscillatoria amoena NRMC-F 0135]